MNCQRAQSQLSAFIDLELPNRERTQLMDHLAGCAACQQELEAISALQIRLSQALQAQAALATPSPQAWLRLQRNLSPASPRPLRSPRATLAERLQAWLSGLPPAHRLAFGAFSLAVLAIASLFAVPSVRAQVGDLIETWFSFRQPDGQGRAAIGGFNAFTPNHPSYLPEGFDLGEIGVHEGPGAASLMLEYTRDGQFVRLVQSAGEAIEGLPKGQSLTLNGYPAVYLDAVDDRGEHPYVPGNQPGVHELVWLQGKVKVMMYSNLPKGEMLKIAVSLQPMGS